MTADITRILVDIENGDPNAASELLPLVYEELRRLAERRMARESPDHTLQPTALVHEAYVRLLGGAVQQEWDNRGHFFAAAAQAMRRILIENARRKRSLKQGGNLARHELREADAAIDSDDAEALLDLDEALTRFAIEDPDAAKLVELRYFAGLTIEQAAKAVGVSTRTAKRNWAYSRAWLRRQLEDDGDETK